MSVIIDLIRKNNEHHVFNSETIKALDIIEDDNLYFLDKNSSSIEYLNNKRKIVTLSVKDSKFYLWIISSIYLIKTLFKYRKMNNIILSSTPLHYFLCVLMSKLFKCNCFIFMHGELGYLTLSQGCGQKLGAFFIKKAFSIQSNVRFVAINEYIYEKVSKIFPNCIFKYVEHPLPSFEDEIIKNKQNNSVINIGTFGIQSKRKNSEDIYALADMLDNDTLHRIRLQTIGITDGSFDYDKSSNVIHYCKGSLNSSLIKKDTFIAAVNDLDFALFFNSEDEKYDLIPSGIICDCIALELPIISLTNNKLKYLFKKYNDIGFLCDSIDDMALLINKLSNDFKKTEVINGNIKKLKIIYSFESYKRKLQTLFER